MNLEDEAELAEAAVQHPTAEMLLCIYNYQRFPWDDGQFQSRVGLRQGMNWGLDRGLMAEVSGDQFKPWGHFLPEIWKDYIDPARLASPLYPNAQRIEDARAGLKDADHEQGIRLPQGMDLAYLPDENTGRIAQDLLEYWREISVKMGPFGEPWNILLERVDDHGHDVVLKRVRPAYPKADALFYPQLFSSLSGLGGNWTGIEDAGIDEQIMTIQAADDPVSRKIALRKLSSELEDRALFVFLGYATPTILINPDLAGYELGAYDFDASLAAQDFTKLGWAEDSGS
jgi:ABC-type transport system substrate-binding protein